MELPIAPSCDLVADGLRRQRERYRKVGDGSILLERTAQLVAVLVPAESAQEVPELLEIENRCCPFFDLAWDPDGRRFSVSVSDQQHEPALDAICFALGV
jgi:hypothetical protein